MLPRPRPGFGRGGRNPHEPGDHADGMKLLFVGVVHLPAMRASLGDRSGARGSREPRELHMSNDRAMGCRRARENFAFDIRFSI